MLFSKKTFTYFFPLIVILNGYASFIPGLSVGSLLMVFFDVYAFIIYTKDKRNIDSFSLRVIALICLFVLISLFDYMVYGLSDTAGSIKILLKLFTWMFGVTFVYNTLFDFESFRPYFRKFCIVCSFYLLIQMIAWNTVKIYIPNLFNFGIIHPLYEQYSAEAYINYLSTIGFGRFSSFFAEPSYYGIVMVLDLLMIFFVDVNDKKFDKKSLFEVLFIILGIWISTSTAAIIFSMLIVVAYIIRGRSSDKIIFIFIGTCVLGFILFVNQNATLLDFFYDKISSMGDNSRVGGSFDQISNLSTIQKVFGVGMGNYSIVTEREYMNQITGFIMSYGFVGLFAFFILLIKLIFTRFRYSLFILMMVYIAAMFQGGYVFNIYGILIICIALSLRDYNYFHDNDLEN